MWPLNRKKNTERQVRAEGDFNAFETEDNYNRKKLLLDTAAIVGVLVLIGGLILLIYSILTNEETRKRVLDLIVANIPGIIYGGLIIFGLKPGKRKNE